MDILTIEGLALDMIIGVYDWERVTKQRVLLDITLKADLSKAAQDDDLQHAIDYDAISALASTVAEEKAPKLIEHFAHCLTQAILDAFPCEEVCITVQKPHAIKQAKTVSFTKTSAARVDTTR